MQGQVDIELVFDALRRRWITLLVPMLLAPIFALTARQIVGPKLKASSQILVREDVKANPVLKGMIVEMKVSRRLPEIRSTIRSRKTIEQVVRQMGVIHDGMPRVEQLAWIDGFRSSVEVFGEGGGLVRISLVGRDSQRVLQGLKLLTKTVIDEMLEPRRRALGQTVAFLESQLSRLKQELEEGESQVATIRAENPNYLPGMRRMKLEAHQALTRSLYMAEAESAGRRSGGRAQSRAELNLAKARQALRNLRAAYTERHPAVKAAKARVRKAEAAVGPISPAPAKKGVANLDTRKSGYLRDRVEESIKELQSISGYEQRLAQVGRTVEGKSLAYTSLLKRYEDAVISRDLLRQEQAGEVRVVEEASQAVVARMHSLPVVFIGGLFGGLLVGLALVLLLELVDPTVRSEKELAALTGAPVLGRLPG